MCVMIGKTNYRPNDRQDNCRQDNRRNNYRDRPNYEREINRDIGIEVKVGRVLEIIIETIQDKDLREVEIDKHEQE